VRQHGLADAGLAGDEVDGALARDGAVRTIRRFVERMLAVQKPHYRNRKRPGRT
jgi:hypothetical protein